MPQFVPSEKSGTMIKAPTSLLTTPTRDVPRLLRLIRRPLGNLALCAVLLLGASGCKDHYENGMDAIVEQRWNDAQNEARLGKAQDPADPRYDLLMARALVNEAMAIEQSQSEGSEYKVESRKATALYNKALPYAKRAYDSGELDATAGRVLGKIYWEQTKPDQTCQAWKRARAADPKSIADTDYLTACRNALKHTEDYDEFARALEIRQELKDLMEAKPDFIKSQGPEVERELQKITSEEAFRTNKEKYAQELTDQRSYEEAIVVYEELSKQYPEESKYHYQRGKLLLEVGRADEASVAFDAYTKTPDKRERIERLKDVARKAEERSVRSIAMRANTALLDELPDTPSRERALIYSKLANLNMQIDDVDGARKYATLYLDELKAIEGGKIKADVYHSVFTQALQHGHGELGVEILEQALVEAEPNIRVMEQLANEYARQARKGDTERVLKTYVERSGNTRKSLEQAARWSSRRRNWDLAQFFYEKITERSDALADDWYELARIYASQGRTDELRTSLEAYLKMRGNDRSAVMKAATLYKEQRLFEESEKLLKKAQKKYPEDMSLARRLVDLYDQGEWGKPDAAHKTWNRWLDARGRKGPDLLQVGGYFYNSGRYDDALSYLNEAADKGERGARLQVARVYANQKRDKELKETLDKFLDSAPNRRRALEDVLEVYNQTNMTDATIEVLEQLIELDMRTLRYYQMLSRYYLLQGRERDAFDLWSKYLEGSRDPYRDLQQIAPYFNNQGNQEWILSFYQQLLDKGRVDAQIYVIVGDIFDDLHRQLQNRSASQDEIDAARAKAEFYYDRYFEEVKPTGTPLRKFARQMQNRKFYTLAERSYRRMIETESRVQHSAWFNHGEVLIELGRMEDAEKAMERYYEETNRRDTAARQIAIKLTAAHRYEAAEVYLVKLLESSSHQHRETAFRNLAEIYRESDRTDEMNKLVTRYLNRSSNVNSARKNIINVAIASGMWDLAIEQLEQTARSKDRGVRFNIGEFQWRAGRFDAAQKTFREHASNADNPAFEWMRVAIFYESHAKPELAKQAYEQAVKAAPKDYNPLLARGRFAILSGNLERGLADFDQALEIAPSTDSARVYQEMMKHLQAAGYDAEVRRVAREGLKLQGVDRTIFLAPLAKEAFSKGEKLAADRMLAELKSSGMNIGALVDMLVAYGFYEEAAQLIEEEIAVGDYMTAGDLLISHGDVFTQLGGIDRLMRAAQPLLDKSRGNARLEGALGEYLIREGHLERGAIFLRVALDKGDTGQRGLLAHTNLQLGYEDEAYKLFLDDLANYPKARRAAALDEILISYSVTKNEDKIRPLLEHLVQDERFIKDATPKLISLMLEEGHVLAATAMLRDFAQAGDRGKKEPTSHLIIGSDVNDVQYREVFLVGVATLATYGYVAEAKSLLDRADAKIKEINSYKTLRFKLELMSEGSDLEQVMLEFIDTSEEATRQARVRNLEMAYLLMLRDKHVAARQIAERELDSGEPEIADAAIGLLMRSAYITEEFDKQAEWAARFLAQQPDRQRTRDQLASIYSALGQDKRAMSLVEENLSKMPIMANIRRAQEIARHKGDAGAFARYSDLLWRVHDKPIDEATRTISGYSDRVSPEFLAPVLKPARAVYPADQALFFMEVFQMMRVGQVVEGREMLIAYLEERQWDEATVESVLLELASRQLFVEAARAIGKQVPEDKLNNRARFLLGISEAGLGFDDEARALLDPYIQSHHQPGWAAQFVARAMYEYDRPALLEHYADMAIRKTPTRPMPYYWRGIARLKAGNLEGAKADFDRSLGGGIGRTLALRRIIIEAAKLGHMKLAEEKTLELIEGAYIEQGTGLASSSSMLKLVLDTWLLAEKPKEGLAILEKHYPHTLAIDVESATTATSLTSLYEGAGLHEQGWQVYEHLIRKDFFHDVFDGGVATYNNNLAYSFSTTNKNITRGEHLVRRAIAASGMEQYSGLSMTPLMLTGRREGSYIDTLGWIYYRQGNLQQAEAEIRRALSDNEGRSSPASTIELYQHLADIREAQGYQEEAVWIRIYLESLE